MRFLVFQHLPVEHPGVLRDFWREDDIHWDAVELDAGEPIPTDLDRYAALVVMGGPQDVWEVDRHPWLLAEKAAIRHWAVELKRPYLGICLGHQLLAEAVGGVVGPMAVPEVGIAPVDKLPAADADPLMAALPTRYDTFQWHGAEVTSLPRDAVVLAANVSCPVQAFRWGEAAYGFQYHCEITATAVEEWGAIPSYEKALEQALGVGALDRLRAEVPPCLPAFRDAARDLHRAFRTLAQPSA